MIAAAGMVSTHAHTMLVAMPQRTAFMRWMLPTPAMAPAMACVVETGRPRCVAAGRRSAAPVSAQNPLRGLSRVRRAAHGAHNAPAAAQRAQRDGGVRGQDHPDRHVEGLLKSGGYSTPVMIPMVFCASLEPCERLNAAAETNCSLRKYLSIFDGLEFRNSQ